MAIRENTNSKINLSPAQIASGAHSELTPNPYKLMEKVFLEGYKDDHKGWFGAADHNIYKPNVVLVRTDLRNGATEVCFASDKVRGFSVNPFYVAEDGNVHLSTWSVGCTVRLMGKSLEDAINEANKEALSNKYCIHELLTIVRKENFMKAFEEDKTES